MYIIQSDVRPYVAGHTIKQNITMNRYSVFALMSKVRPEVQ